VRALVQIELQQVDESLLLGGIDVDGRMGRRWNMWEGRARVEGLHVFGAEAGEDGAEDFTTPMWGNGIKRGEAFRS
jgi:hypothetical protein